MEVSSENGLTPLFSFNEMCLIPLEQFTLNTTQKKLFFDELLPSIFSDGSSEQIEGAISLWKKSKASISWSSLTPNERKIYDRIRFKQVQIHLAHLSQFHSERHCQTFTEGYNSKGIDYWQAHASEVLSKVLSYLDPEVINGKTLSLPTPDESGKLRPVEYAIESHALPGNLPFYILRPNQEQSSPPPTWVVIRGTDPNVIGKVAGEDRGAIASLLADFLSPEGICTRPIDDAIHTISDQLPAGAPIYFAGHSLGGTYAQHMALKVQERSSSLEEQHRCQVFAFNAPGVGKATYDLYTESVAHGANDQLSIFNFDKQGDVVPSVGRHLIGDHFRVVRPLQLNPTVVHRELDLNKPHALQQVDVEAEMQQGSRLLSEGVRTRVGGLAARTAVKLIEWLHSSETLRSWLPTLPSWATGDESTEPTPQQQESILPHAQVDETATETAPHQSISRGERALMLQRTLQRCDKTDTPLRGLLEDQIATLFQTDNYEDNLSLRETINSTPGHHSNLFKLVYEELSEKPREKILTAIRMHAAIAKTEGELTSFYSVYTDVDDTMVGSLNDKATNAAASDGFFPGALEFHKVMNSAEDGINRGNSRWVESSAAKLTLLSARPRQARNFSDGHMEKRLPPELPFFALYGSGHGILQGARYYTEGKLAHKLAPYSPSERAKEMLTGHAAKLEKAAYGTFAEEKEANLVQDLQLWPEMQPIMIGDSGEGDGRLLELMEQRRQSDPAIPPVKGFIHVLSSKPDEAYSQVSPYPYQEKSDDTTRYFRNYGDMALYALQDGLISPEGARIVYTALRRWSDSNPIDLKRSNDSPAWIYRRNLQNSLLKLEHAINLTTL